MSARRKWFIATRAQQKKLLIALIRARKAAKKEY